MTTAGARRHSRGRDIAWSVLIVVMVLYGVAAVVSVVAGIVTTNWLAALRASPSILFCYWIGVGAWRRTSWGAGR